LSCYSIEIQLFGSCACGIAIKNSDIDIAVKSEIVSMFEYLPENLRLMGAL
jgi:predicted nucleotidyltransferase